MVPAVLAGGLLLFLALGLWGVSTRKRLAIVAAAAGGVLVLAVFVLWALVNSPLWTM